jgi:hypothetical protein
MRNFNSHKYMSNVKNFKLSIESQIYQHIITNRLLTDYNNFNFKFIAKKK